MNTALNAERRRTDLAHASVTTADVLVIGLGATGAGVALDAASRGLSVVAIDAHDMAFGTSRWSSKLIHGGLRYLANREFDIAYESAIERGILMTSTAPHLIKPLPIVMPQQSSASHLSQFALQTGLMIGDALRIAARTPKSVLPKPGRISTEEAQRLVPAMDASGIGSAMLSFDGQLEDDARLVIGLARTAAGHGAKILTYVRALELSESGATVRDELTGETTELKARVVINATGVWASQLDPSIHLRPSRGTHVVVRAERLGNPVGSLTVPEVGEKNRYVFAIPQTTGLVYLGLTDIPVEMPIPDEPQASQAEIDFIINTINPYLIDRLTNDDIVGTFAGLRPLIESEGGRTADVSRRHAVVTTGNHLVTIIGGKLTTYRKMAQDALDKAVELAGLEAGPCMTRSLPIVGAGSTAGFKARGIDNRLIRRYGTEAEIVAGSSFGHEPIAETIRYTPAELEFGVSHEGALTIEDVLDRRTRIGLVQSDRALAEPIARSLF